MIGERASQKEIAISMQAFSVRLAKRINRAFRRRGPVFAGRYHVRELKTPREVWLALRYVLLDARHHAQDNGLVLPEATIDARSSAATFDGWRTPTRHPNADADYGTSPAQSWLLRVGWRKYGPIDVDDVPGPTRNGAPSKQRAA